MRRPAIDRRVGGALVALALGLFAVGSSAPLLRPVLAAAPTPPRPDPLTQAHLDGCQRNVPGLYSRSSPEWVYVYNTPAAVAAPPPVWVTGTVSSGTSEQAVHTSGGDLPFGHAAYDYNLSLQVDPSYSNLMGGDPQKKTGNFADGPALARLHTEWEDLTLPQFAWAEPGDRVTMLGSWVWDCGHWGPPSEQQNPDYTLPKVGQPCLGIVDPRQCVISGEETEIHPYRATWVVRQKTVTSPTGEAEGDLFISSEKTLAGAEADCAHRYLPLPTAVDYDPQYRACVQTDTRWQDVTGDYTFHLPAPPRPSAGARLTYRTVGYDTAAASPVVTPEGDGVRVFVHVSSPKDQLTRVGYAVYAGWDEHPAAALPTHLRVSFDTLEIHRSMDPGCSQNAFGLPTPGCTTANESTRNEQAGPAPGQWNLYVDVNGIWNRWTRLGNGELDVNDGTVLNGEIPPVDLFVPPGTGWRFFVHGRECDLGSFYPASALPPPLDCPGGATDIASDNDVTGQVVDTYRSALSSLGKHRSNGQTRKQDPTSTCPDINPEGCYSITYTVSLVDDATTRATAPAAPVPAPLPNTTGMLVSSMGFLLLLAVAGLLVRGSVRGRPGRT